MAQVARPDSDVSIGGGWAVTPSGTFYTTIDESVADDTDHISTGNTGQTAKAGLSNVTDPVSSTGHSITVRAKGSGAGAEARVRLDQGGTNIVPYTVVPGTIGTTYADYTLTLTGAQADAITDYNDLQLSMEFSLVPFLGTGFISQAFMTVPDAPATAVSSTRTLKYNISAGVSSTRTLKYDISNGVSSTRTFKYNIDGPTPVDSTRTIKYDMSGAVSAQRSLVYNISAGVSSTRTIKYNLDPPAAVSSERILVYNLSNGVSSQRTIRYNIANLVVTYSYQHVGWQHTVQQPDIPSAGD